MKDMNGVTLTLGARILTKNNKIGFIISLHPDSGKVRVRLKSGLIRKLSACEVVRW